jgi:hypothetical protein
MMRGLFFIVIVLAGAYVVDRYWFAGRHYQEIRVAASNLGRQINYKVNNLLKPLGR